MGKQLIICVETNHKSKTDSLYIRETIDHFYTCPRGEYKFTFLEMDGKSKYKAIETKIQKSINQYAVGNSDGISNVIYCFDCDQYDIRTEDRTFLNEAKLYCESKKYDFVWFCRDVEQVYLGKSVKDSEKVKKAAEFKRKKGILSISESDLVASVYQQKKSNILRILDKYLPR